jgi:hypothetical protein
MPYSLDGCRILQGMFKQTHSGDFFVYATRKKNKYAIQIQNIRSGDFALLRMRIERKKKSKSQRRFTSGSPRVRQTL